MKSLVGKTLIKPGLSRKTGMFDNYADTLNMFVLEHANGKLKVRLPDHDVITLEESDVADDFKVDRIRVVESRITRTKTLRRVVESDGDDVVLADDGVDVEFTPEGEPVLVQEPDDTLVFLNTAQLQQIQGCIDNSDVVDASPLEYQVLDADIASGADTLVALAWDPSVAHRDIDAISQGDWTLVNTDGSISDGTSSPDEYLFPTVEAARAAAIKASRRALHVWENTARTVKTRTSATSKKTLGGKVLEYRDRRIGLTFKQGFMPKVKKTR